MLYVLFGAYGRSEGSARKKVPPKNKEKLVTIRLEKELYQKITNKAIEASVVEGRIIKVSEIIREALKNLVN